MKRLNKAISEEGQAPRDYSKLLKQTKSKRDKKIIRRIIKDERRHKKLLIKIKRRSKQ